jgi:lipoprotein NlpD
MKVFRGLRRIRAPIILAMIVAMVGCASQPPAPIEQISTSAQGAAPVAVKPQPAPRKRQPFKGETYRVQAGDTLYSIAWRLGVDFRQLARWNGIDDPHHIVVGQILRVRPATIGKVVVDPSATSAGTLATSTPTAKVVSTKVTPGKPDRRASDIPPPAGASPSWVWPADGKAMRAVSATGSIGLEIKGTRGQSIRAAGSGQVVYAGSGLRGYGQLLIVKHDEIFLSAYAHNDKLLVAEGQHVERGQPIALMGDSGASEVMLHFEIRKGGKAVEPLQYLPKH